MKKLMMQLAFGLMIFLQVDHVYAQKIQQKRNVEVHRNSQTDEIEKLIFKNSGTKTKRVFDVQSNNPFNSILSSGIIPDTDFEYGFDLIEIRDKTLGQILSTDGISSVKGKREMTVAFIKNEVNMVFDGEKNVHGVLYSLNLYNKNKVKCAAVSEFRLVNKDNSTTSALKLEVDARNPFISDDGKFLSFSYGGEFDHMGNKIFDSAVSIYDAESNKEIFSKFETRGFFASSIFFYKGFFIYHEKNGREVLYHVIDVANRTHFEKVYSYEAYDLLEDINDEGLVFSDGRTDRFKDSFNTSTF